MVSNVYWSVGKRSDNQDSLAFSQVLCKQGNMSIALVADGIGSLSNGEIASGYVAERLISWFYESAVGTPFRKHDKLVRSLNRTLFSLHADLKEYGEKEGCSLGTTCICILMWERKYLLFQIGDSKAFLFRKKKVRSLVPGHRNERGELTKCIGSMGYYQADFYVGKVRKKDGICLCTDGFYSHGESHFKELLAPKNMTSEETIERRLSMLGKQNEKNGEKDNQSAIYMYFD